MARVKRGVIARARHKKILKQAKGYYGARSRVYRVAFRLLSKLVSMLTATVVSVSVSSVSCGSHVSTLRRVRTVSLTAVSSMA